MQTYPAQAVLGPFQANWSVAGLKKRKADQSAKSGNVVCDTIITKVVKVYDPNAPYFC